MSCPHALVAMARPPWPPDTGAKIRALQVLSGIARRFRVQLLTFVPPGPAPAWLGEAMRTGVAEVETVPHPGLDQAMSPGLFARGLLRCLPGSVLKYQTAAFAQAFIARLARRPALVHLEHVHLGSALELVRACNPSSIVSLDAHNIEWTIAQRMREMEASWSRKAALALHAKLMRRFETHTFRACDLVMAVSNEDAVLARRMTGGAVRAEVVENGVDANYFHPAQNNHSDGNAMVFTGSMDWLPNADAMVWFCAEVLPRIRVHRPTASLTIVGRNPRPEVAVLHDPDRGVRVTGTVDDIRPYVHDAALVLAPLRFGGGTRLKILEAFAMGKAVVSTTLGCEGIACRDGEHLLVRDSPDPLAQACVQLLDNPSLRRNLGDQARALALKHYTWNAITGRMGQLLGELAEKRHG